MVVRQLLASLAVVVLFGAFLAQGAIAGSAAGGLGADCSASATFWPHAHPAVKSLGFPPFQTPHIEVYRNNGQGLASFGNAEFVGYVGAAGAAVLGGGCRHVLYHAVSGHRNPWVTRSTSTDFACTTGTHVQIAKVAGVWRVRVVDLAGEIVLDRRSPRSAEPPPTRSPTASPESPRAKRL